MQQYWLKKSGAPRLIIYVLGWGCDHRCVEHIEWGDECDVLTIYDYDSIEIIDSVVTDNYSDVVLIAWSFGVWVAEQICGEIKISRAIALNGTPFPVNDEFGLAPKRVLVTIKGIAKSGVEPFLMRTYGVAYDELKSKLDVRPMELLIAELTSLYNMSLKDYRPWIEWNRVVIGADDVIFPPENMIRYWGNHAKILPLPHYPFYSAEIIKEEVELR